VLSLLLLSIFFSPVSSATLTWTYNDNLHEGFIIFRRQAGTGYIWQEIQRVDKNTLKYVDQHNDVLYCYYVKAYAGTRISARSNIACMTVINPTDLVIQE
jgi:hypothetical protein